MRRAPLIAVLAAGLVLSGCGIPDDTDVRPLRPGPSTGVSSGSDTAPRRSARADTQDRALFVQNYLEAAAGDFDSAAEQVKQFLTPEAAVNFKASADIKVVRLTEPPLVEPGNPTVVIKVQQVGTLDANGILEPGGNRSEYRLKLKDEGQDGLFVETPPQVLLLRDDALDRFYTPHSIYFWNRDGTGLVPDVRYMPLTVPSEQRPNQVIDWLTTGPSRWLTDVVNALPEGTKPVGNVPAVSDDTLRISLSGQAVAPDDPGARDRLQKQLRWSLGSYLPAALELTVEHQAVQTYTGADYLAGNPAYRQIAEAERFAIYNGQIRRLARSYNAAQPVPVIAPDANKGIRSAALSSAGNRWWGALVVGESRGRQALRVGASGPGDFATLRRVALSGEIGRPVWAKSPVGADAGTTGLVTAGGRLHWFSADGSAHGEVGWPSRPRTVGAVAVAPDAHRIAVVADGALIVGALTRNEDGAVVTQPRVIRTRLTELTAVDWSSEGVLVVAGKRPETGRVAIMEVSIDGATQTDRLSDLGSNPVNHLTALPANPARGEESGAIAYMLGGGAYDDLNPDKIGVDDLAEQIPNPPANVSPVSPFFLN